MPTVKATLIEGLPGLSAGDPGSLTVGLILLMNLGYWLMNKGDWLLTNLLFCVDPERFELSTFSMPLRRAPNCAMGPISVYSVHVSVFSFVNYSLNAGD